MRISDWSSDVCSSDLLPVSGSAEPNPRWASAFVRARAAVPKAEPGWSAQFAIEHNVVSLYVVAPALQGASKISFFPYARDLVNHDKPQSVAAAGETVRLRKMARTEEGSVGREW